MGLKDKVKDFFIKKEIRNFEEKHMKAVKGVIGWFADPEHPGRKRGIAAFFGATSVVLRTYGKNEYVQYVDGLGDVIQNVVIPGSDLATIVFAVIGIGHAAKAAAAK